MSVFLPQNVARLASLVGDASRYALAGVRVVECKDGYRLEATDGRRLAIVHGQHDPKDLEGMAAAGLERAANGCLEYVVPADRWKAGFQALAKTQQANRHLRRLPLGLKASTNEVTICTGDATFLARQVEGRWPDTDRVLPKGAALFSIRVNPRYFLDLLQLAYDLSGQEEGKGVVLNFYRGMLGISASHGGQFFDGLLMPIGDADEFKPKHAPKEEPEEDEVPEAEPITAADVEFVRSGLIEAGHCCQQCGAWPGHSAQEMDEVWVYLLGDDCADLHCPDCARKVVPPDVQWPTDGEHRNGATH